jgi:hypothetical protein
MSPFNTASMSEPRFSTPSRSDSTTAVPSRCFPVAIGSVLSAQVLRAWASSAAGAWLTSSARDAMAHQTAATTSATLSAATTESGIPDRRGFEDRHRFAGDFIAAHLALSAATFIVVR